MPWLQSCLLDLLATRCMAVHGGGYLCRTLSSDGLFAARTHPVAHVASSSGCRQGKVLCILRLVRRMSLRCVVKKRCVSCSQACRQLFIDSIA